MASRIICVLALTTIITILVEFNSAQQITDCETVDAFRSMTLFCGRSPVEQEICVEQSEYGRSWRRQYSYSWNWDICDSYENGTCYSKAFSEEIRAHEVEKLNLGDCPITVMDRELSTIFTNITAYSISHADLTHLSSENLPFQNLTEFDASHNSLTELAGSLFINILEIKEIDFSYNKINFKMH